MRSTGRLAHVAQSSGFAERLPCTHASGRCSVVCAMRLCTTGEVWQVIERLPPRLPRGAKLWIVATAPRRQQPWMPLEGAVVAVL
jgi:hypothetical protein